MLSYLTAKCYSNVFYSFLINYRSNRLGNTFFCCSCMINISVKQIEISFECYIRYQWNFQSVVKKLYSWFAQLNLVTPSIIELVEQHTRAATYVKVLAKMECVHWANSINHHIPNWEIKFLTIELAMTWTNYAYS